MSPPLELTRAQILAFRRRVGALDVRLPAGRRSLREAAWAGLQDSMPRAAVLSVHARVEGAEPSVWEDPAFVQLWGPRYSVYVVPAQDRAVFSLGRLPDDAKGRRRAESLAARVHDHLRGSEQRYDEVGQALPMPGGVASCGLLACGPVRFSSRVRSAGRGGVRARRLRSRSGDACRVRCARRSRLRPL